MFNLSDQEHSRTFNGAKALGVIVTGFAFMDLSHQCRECPKAGCNHGGNRVQTLWEIHPVLTLSRMNP